jgi:hypothetical protein
MSFEETNIELPRRDDNLWIQLTPTGGTLPDVPFAIFVFKPGSTTHGRRIPANENGRLNTRYDLGATANSLVGFKLLCQGAAIFKQKDSFTLTCEFFVAGKKLPASAATLVSGDPGHVAPFQIRCKFI